MKQFRPLSILATALTLAACAGHTDHRSGHLEHKSEAPPSEPAKVSESTPNLTSGYVKVAAPAGAGVYFPNLRNGMEVSSPLKVVFGLTGMGIAPAGVEKVGTGHHHLLIDVNEWDANAPLPANDNFRHFGSGQTEVLLQLKPGTHTLQLVLGDQNHIPHHPVVMSERITLTVR